LRLVLCVVAGLLLCVFGIAAAAPIGKQYDSWDVASFDVTGVPDELDQALEDGLALAGRRKLLRRQHPSFSADLLRDDIRRTRLFLARKGYPRAQVEPRLVPRSNRRRLDVELRIDPGQRVHITGIEVRGFDSAEALPSPDRWPIRQGDPFDQDIVEAARSAITQRVQERGYARAKTSVQLADRTETEVVVIFQVNPGDKQYFGDVQVEGVPDDLEKVARRSVQVHPGERFTPEAVTRTDENLRYLGLFRRVDIDLEPVAADTLDVGLGLSERSHRQLQTGVGYFTDDHLRLRAEWSHNNLFHEGRGLGIQLRGTIYEQNASISVWKPALFVPRTRGTVRLAIIRQNEDNYEALLQSASFWITQILSLDVTLRYGVEVSYNDYRAKTEEAVEFEENEGLLTALEFDWLRETARDRLWPVNGSSQTLRTRWAPPGGISEAQFVLVEPDVALYRQPFDRYVVTGRLRLGLGAPQAGREIPPNERFYAGGASSHRGFARRKLGPKDSAGAAVGGAAKVESSIETRFPLFRSLFGAVFFDAGQVWPRMSDARVGDVEVATGLGMMIKTPAGPLRIDYAWRLTHQDRTQPMRQFHFSIGNPY
jgi:outer membrane protein assembly complex protein YaeT